MVDKTQQIIQSTNEISKCLLAKELLYENNFFNEARLRQLYNYLNENNHIGSYIYSLTLQPSYIKITARKTYFKKYNNSYDSTDFNLVINDCINMILEENKEEIDQIFNNHKMIIDNIPNTSLLYTLSRPNDTTMEIRF